MAIAGSALLLLAAVGTPWPGIPAAKADEAAAEADDAGEPAAVTRLTDIAGTEWRLASLTVGDQVHEVAADVAITFTVDDDGRVGGRSAVNRYFGTLTLGEDGAVEWPGPFGTTRMAGPPHLMDWESRYLDALARTDRMTTSPTVLILAGAENKVVLRFTPAADAPGEPG